MRRLRRNPSLAIPSEVQVAVDQYLEEGGDAVDSLTAALAHIADLKIERPLPQLSALVNGTDWEFLWETRKLGTSGYSREVGDSLLMDLWAALSTARARIWSADFFDAFRWEGAVTPSDTWAAWLMRMRAQVTAEFGLGDELAHYPWFYLNRDSKPQQAPLWFEGAPEGYFGSAKERQAEEAMYRSAIGTPSDVFDERGWWGLQYRWSSGETECPNRYTDEVATGIVTEEDIHPSYPGRCYFCEERLGAQHGWIWQGDNLCVYRVVPWDSYEPP